ncbi:FAD-dependent oxidoreductase [Nocardia sp. NPDC049707]|uniref:FAD-dependent oxidoreductase n=1 Tax=Nocardia sp. NPDC049707 TaxID=3154735 RepID=UPI00344583BD
MSCRPSRCSCSKCTNWPTGGAFPAWSPVSRRTRSRNSPSPANIRRARQGTDVHQSCPHRAAQSRELLAMPEDQRLAASLETVRSHTGDRGLTTVQASTYDWAQDKYALGAYPAPSSERDGFYEPIENTVFRAGAVTSTIHKSYSTGLTAGEAVLRTM